MQAVLSLIDRISAVLVFVATVLLVLLISVTLWEVFARYVLNSPTLWVLDVVNFFNGALLALGAAYAQRRRSHVSIDVFSRRFPPRFAAMMMAVMFCVLVLPTIGVLAYEATMQTWKYYVSGRLLESGWRPLRWPFYVPIALGLWALWLQCVATVIRLLVERFQPPEKSCRA